MLSNGYLAFCSWWKSDWAMKLATHLYLIVRATMAVIAQVVSHQLLTVAARVRNQVGSLVDKVALRQVFLRVLQFFPGNIIPLLLHIHSCTI
jgi:hypothetical protein